MTKNSLSKTFSILCFISSISGLTIMYFADLGGNNFENFLYNNIRFFSYFTILSNIFVAIVSGRTVFSKQKVSENIKSSVLLYILITGSIYFAVLRNVWTPQGWKYAGDILLHYSTPILYLLFWIFSSGKSLLKKDFFIKVTIFPFIYLFYTFLKGIISGHYPYPFMEVDKIGYFAAVWNSIIILIIMLILSLPVFFINNSIFKKTSK